MVEFKVPYESKMDDSSSYKREKYKNWSKDQEKAGFESHVLPTDIGIRRFFWNNSLQPSNQANFSQMAREELRLSKAIEDSSQCISGKKNEELLHK
ncbi:reverse transcriptase [Plakobranchus ocellatus]|uniref:Reverse transcriptase n=1 Tax=Plakobranchus ocellatus TaxID=259542 RepID=A0AAV4APB8_9GAST|nr:reverse transcriptase [Plakobranchus ocellatus]